nr:unnamed protein product [Meloidogyne enterolobii]
MFYEAFFRTNCYILNKKKECCAHDFKFMKYWIKKDGTNFAMKNPKTQQNFIDLKDLLFNAPLYAKWFKDSSDSENYFYSTRSCVENNKNKYYCAQKESEVIFFTLTRNSKKNFV